MFIDKIVYELSSLEIFFDIPIQVRAKFILKNNINKHFMLFLLFIITIGSFIIGLSLYLLLMKLTF